MVTPMNEEQTTDVRRGTSADADIIAQFNVKMAIETENRKLDPETVRAGVRNLLDNPDAGFYLVALRGPQVVGCLMVTHEWSDWRDGLFWWIQSVYVDPAHRRQGVFRALYGQLRRMADEHPQVCGLRLYVEQSNLVAQKTYESLAMSRTPYQVFEIELP